MAEERVEVVSVVRIPGCRKRECRDVDSSASRHPSVQLEIAGPRMVSAYDLRGAAAAAAFVLAVCSAESNRAGVAAQSRRMLVRRLPAASADSVLLQKADRYERLLAVSLVAARRILVGTAGQLDRDLLNRPLYPRIVGD